MRPDVRFDIKKKSSLSSLLKFLLAIPETDLALAAALTRTLRTRFQVCRYVYTQIFFFCYLLYNIIVTVIISYVIFCTCTVTNMHYFAFT